MVELRKRITSQENDNGDFEVLTVEDGPDGRSLNTVLDSTLNTSPEANDRVRELNEEIVHGARYPAEEKEALKAHRKALEAEQAKVDEARAKGYHGSPDQPANVGKGSAANVGKSTKQRSSKTKSKSKSRSRSR
jgi:hypothetical protein